LFLSIFLAFFLFSVLACLVSYHVSLSCIFW
jgi:hypothetical protein